MLKRIRTVLAALARAWADGRDAELPPIPFPSAIAPRLAFHAAADAAKRVRAAADSFEALEPVAPADR